MFYIYTLLLSMTLFMHSCVADESQTTYQYDFAVSAIFQDEAPYLKEWLEYHKLMGAQHFYLYNNESTDAYLEVLAPYLASGLVELTQWTEPDFQFSGQKKAYMDAINKAKGVVKWLAIIDIDEYLVPKTENTVPAVLKAYEKPGIGALAVHWQMFGTSCVPKIMPGELLAEKLIYRAPQDYNENLHVKSIVRPEYVVEPPHVHYFEFKPGYQHVTTDFKTFTSSRPTYVVTDVMQINHYWMKDEWFFRSIKVPRRIKWGESPEIIEQRIPIFNEVKDTSIERFLPALKARMFPSQKT